jgi:hydroxymethylbilane synthase
VPRAIRIGTRKSRLAQWQANWVAGRLRELHPGLEVDVEIVKTTGDTIQDRPLAAIGVRGLFTKELDAALLDGRVDLVVHSLKDVPTALPEGLILAAVPPREDPRDVFVGSAESRLGDVAPGEKVGTGSLRRRALVLNRRPDLEVVDLRGNVDTRLRRVRESDTLGGAILALAGLRRLGVDTSAMEIFDLGDWPPAVGQGALGVVARVTDAPSREALAPLEHAPTRAAVTSERALLARLEGGCHVPVGSWGWIEGGELILDSFVAHPDGNPMIRDQARGPAENAAALGEEAAERLLAAGGAEILAELEQTLPRGD